MTRRFLMACFLGLTMTSLTQADYPYGPAVQPATPAGYLPGTMIPAGATTTQYRPQQAAQQSPVHVSMQTPMAYLSQPMFQQANYPTQQPIQPVQAMMMPVYATGTPCNTCQTPCATGACQSPACGKGCLAKLKDWLFYRPSKQCYHPLAGTPHLPEPWEYIHARPSQMPLMGVPDCSICRVTQLRHHHHGACPTCGVSACGADSCGVMASGAAPFATNIYATPPTAMNRTSAPVASQVKYLPTPTMLYAQPPAMPAKMTMPVSVPAPLPVAMKPVAPAPTASSPYAMNPAKLPLTGNVLPIRYDTTPTVNVTPGYTQRTSYPTPPLTPKPLPSAFRDGPPIR